MQVEYALQVISTGQTILTKSSDRSAAVWHKSMERKVLRYKYKYQQYRDAVDHHDTIVAWVNYDQMVRALPENEMRQVRKRVFRGYDKFFDLHRSMG